MLTLFLFFEFLIWILYYCSGDFNLFYSLEKQQTGSEHMKTYVTFNLFCMSKKVRAIKIFCSFLVVVCLSSVFLENLLLGKMPSAENIIGTSFCSFIKMLKFTPVMQWNAVFVK